MARTHAAHAAIDDSSHASGTAPGKRTLTAQLAPRTLQAKGAASGAIDAPPSGGGAALDPAVAARAGATLGHDFSSVRVHTGGHADALGTRAFAYGDDLHFAAGAYDPSSAGGASLLGHELTHVAQQRDGQVAPTGAMGGVAVNTDPSLEAAADAGGARVAQGFDLGGFLDFTPRASGPIATPVAQGEGLSTATAAPAAGAQTHVVQPREKIATIAARYGVTVDALKTANAALLKKWTIGEGATAKVVEGFDAGVTIVIPGVAPVATPAPTTGSPTTETPAAEPGLLDGAVDAISGAIDGVVGAVTGAVGAVTDAAGAAWDFFTGPTGAPVEPDKVAVDDKPIAAEPTAPKATSPAFFSQRDNLTGKDGAETIGESNRVEPDRECNVTTLAMQLVALAGGDKAKVNQETMAKLADAGQAAAADDVNAQPEDLILRLFIKWGDAYWQKVCADAANQAFFPKMDVNVSFYAWYSDPTKNTAKYGWHQIGQCLAYVGQLYSFTKKTGAAGYDEQKAGNDGGLSHDPTDAAYYQALKPKVDAGAAVMLSTKLTGGHIIMLVGIDDAGIWVHDPYGVKVGGAESSSTGYVRNNESSPKTKAALFDEHAANIPVRFKKNPALAAIATSAEQRVTPQPNWGESNYYTFAEVKTYQIGKWNSVLEKA